MLQVTPHHHVLCLYDDFGWGYRILLYLKRRFPTLLFRLMPFYATDMWRLEFNGLDRFGRIVNAQKVVTQFQQVCVETN